MWLYMASGHMYSLPFIREMVEQVEKTSCRRDSRFCLGMAEYNCCGSAGDELEAKQKWLSLVKKKTRKVA